MDATQRARFSAAAILSGVAAVIAWATLAAPSSARSALRPSDDSILVAQLPARSSASAKALQLLRSRARTQPANLDAALALARAQIELSRVDGDPRALAYAEETLSPWLAATPISPEVLVLSATVAQSRHDFAAALQKLDQALAHEPAHAQALLTRASILSVTGRYDEASQSCTLLGPVASALVVHACIAPLRSLRGDFAGAEAELTASLRLVRASSERAWLESLLAELTFWAGRDRSAEAHARTALSLDSSDRYTRALLADILLDAKRPREVRALLVGHVADDALLLRDALAARALGDPEAAELWARVQDRTAQNRLRGDVTHQREEARFLLATKGEEARALRTAQANFQVQHEPWDVRILLESAHAADDPAAAAPARDWLKTTKFESPMLRELARQLGEKP